MIGGGILVMHYIGMAGLELCRAVYSLARRCPVVRRSNRAVYAGGLDCV